MTPGIVPLPAAQDDWAAVQQLLGPTQVVGQGLAERKVDPGDIVLLPQLLSPSLGELLLILGLDPRLASDVASRLAFLSSSRAATALPLGADPEQRLRRIRPRGPPPARRAGRRPPCSAATTARLAPGARCAAPGSAGPPGTAAGPPPAPRPSRTRRCGSLSIAFRTIVSRSRGIRGSSARGRTGSWVLTSSISWSRSGESKAGRSASSS